MPTESSTAPGYLILLVKMAGYDPFWRRLRFPAQFTLLHLHQAIQSVTLFGGYHLHKFIARNGQLYASEAKKGSFDPKRCHLEQETAAGEVLREKGDTIQYDYDFGDKWEFSILVEEWEPIPAGEAAHVTCLGGEAAGPVEDCGGVDGFLYILETLAGSDKKKKKDLAWKCEGYDPNLFDVEMANLELASIKGPRITTTRKRKKSPNETASGE